MDNPGLVIAARKLEFRMRLGAARIESLDALRGIAAFTVVTSHVWETLRDSLEPSSAWPLNLSKLASPYFLFTYTPLQLLVAGTPAVLLFFVLSGFVLSIAWQNGAENAPSYGNFAVRRVCRIYLPFVVAILGAILLTYIIKVTRSNFDEFAHYWQYEITTKLVVQHLAMAIDENLVLDPPAWSLVYEMRISAFFPLLAIFVLRFGIRPSVVMAASIYFISWAALRLLQGNDSLNSAIESLTQSTLMTIHYTPFFIAGIILSFLYFKNGIDKSYFNGKKSAPIWIGSLILMCPIWYRFSVMIAHLFWGVGGALLLLLALESQLARLMLSSPPIKWLGRVSYSLYLTHLPVLYFCLSYFYSRGFSYLSYLFAFVAIGVVSQVSYAFVEVPSIRLGRLVCNRLGLK